MRCGAPIRLFQIVQHLRGRRLTTAAQLAGWLRVSERTVYRDIRDLSISGVPVEGEAGVGYRLRPGFDFPPMMLTMDEVEALVAGARMMETWGGTALGSHARSAIAKIALALPAARREEIERTRLFAPGFLVPKDAVAGLETVRQAIFERRKLHIRVRGWGEPRFHSHDRSARAEFLGYDLVGGGLVRNAGGVPGFSVGPDSELADGGREV